MRFLVTCFLFLLALYIFGCGPALVDQVRLNRLGTTAADSCVAQKRQEKCTANKESLDCKAATAVCQSALGCTSGVEAAVKQIQAVQVLRAGTGASKQSEKAAQQKNNDALQACAKGGWR